ncbi:hypothetical protein PENTCL1PPCAC_17067 [Pristionchus entomophagus]|uniref:Nuclear receptor n=1 Tax=Pristionchus entomophagus TaxID=358040 RepID=A0AAV5TL47_9BILA|nr:hypothetical protein PENTCL1PPCAC_17067 [Pristionchus entomophagus]
MSVIAADSGKCLVCAAPITSIHFGIDACRACTSFFKRTKLSGKRFPCRRGGPGRCDITRGDNFVCRRCRFDKCVEVGMVYEGLMRAAKKTPKEDRQVSTIIETPSMSNERILGKIAREYKSCMDRRRVQERILISTANVKERLPHPTEEIYSTNFECSIRTLYISITEIWSFFKVLFPSLMERPLSDQLELFRTYLPKVHSVECFFRTIQIFGNCNKYLMCSAIMSVNKLNPEDWISPTDGGSNRSTLVETLRVYVNDQMAVVVPSLERAQITEREMHALLALILCDSDWRTDSCERLLSSLDEIRSEVLEDLRRYYKEELGLTEYSTRLGNLMTVCHAIREANTIFQECFRMQVTLFDLYTSEKLIQELFL